MSGSKSKLHNFIQKLIRIFVAAIVLAMVYATFAVINQPISVTEEAVSDGTVTSAAENGSVRDYTKIDYDPEAALSYAAAHWDDGVGDCADFASACLRAGGIPADLRGATNLMNYLKEEFGEDYIYELVITDGKYRLSDNIGKISAGDPVFWYCSECDMYGHTSICSGADNDILVDYAHNNPHNGHVSLWTGAHRKAPITNEAMCSYSALYSFHLSVYDDSPEDLRLSEVKGNNFYGKN